MVGRRGLSSSEMLLALGVLLLLAAILYPIYSRSQRRQLSASDAVQMRRLFAGIMLYQEDHQGTMPGTLLHLGDAADPADLVSPTDPFADHSGPFPVEPALPDQERTADQRVSYSYLGNFLRTGKSSLESWGEATLHMGLLANVWSGSYEETGPFTAKVNGPVQRIRMDGALSVIPAPKGSSQGDFDLLFVRQPE